MTSAKRFAFIAVCLEEERMAFFHRLHDFLFRMQEHALKLSPCATRLPHLPPM